MSTETAGAAAFLGLPVLGITTLLVTGCLHLAESPTPVKVTPITVPAYADCSGDSPVDPCVRPLP